MRLIRSASFMSVTLPVKHPTPLTGCGVGVFHDHLNRSHSLKSSNARESSGSPTTAVAPAAGWGRALPFYDLEVRYTDWRGKRHQQRVMVAAEGASDSAVADVYE